MNGEWCDTPQKENPAPVKGNISGCWIQDRDFQSLFIHPFCAVRKTPGRQLWKHPGAGSEVTARSQRCHRRPVAFITSFLSGKSCSFKWSSSQALLCPSASRWTRCYWAIPQDGYSIAGINPQEEEGNSVSVETGFYPSLMRLQSTCEETEGSGRVWDGIQGKLDLCTASPSWGWAAAGISRMHHSPVKRGGMEDK